MAAVPFTEDVRLVAGMWRLTDWRLTLPERVAFIEHCLSQGVTWVDHARVYGAGQAEWAFGEALAQLPPSRRAQVRLVTKCGIEFPGLQGSHARLKHYDLSAARIASSVDQSLQALGVERVDLLLLHRPSPLMDYDEMAQALQRLQAAGKLGAVGVSNFSVAQFEALNQRLPLATQQIECSPLHLNPVYDGMLDHLQGQGVRPMFWSALGGGRLFDPQAPADLQAVRTAFERAAQTLGLPSAAAAVYAWLWRLPCRPVLIAGSGRTQAVDEAVAASACAFPLELWFELLAAIQGHEVP